MFLRAPQSLPEVLPGVLVDAYLQLPPRWRFPYALPQRLSARWFFAHVFTQMHSLRCFFPRCLILNASSQMFPRRFPHQMLCPKDSSWMRPPRSLHPDAFEQMVHHMCLVPYLSLLMFFVQIKMFRVLCCRCESCRNLSEIGDLFFGTAYILHRPHLRPQV